MIHGGGGGGGGGGVGGGGGGGVSMTFSECAQQAIRTDLFKIHKRLL
jgi:hypothetical protein